MFSFGISRMVIFVALTSNSDLYGAVHDDGIKRVVNHVMYQRPSLFNYGTAAVKTNPNLLCEPIVASPSVTEKITVLPLIPLFPFGTVNISSPELGVDLSIASNLGLDFAAQLTALQVDFHPGDIFTLPSELNPPLQSQRIAFRVRVCAGLGCIPREILQRIPIDKARLDNSRMIRSSRYSARRNLSLRDAGAEYEHVSSKRYEAAGSYSAAVAGLREIGPLRPLFPLPIRKLECFCLELFGVGHSEFQGPKGDQRLLLRLDGVELVDIAPKGLENSLECYLQLLVDRVVLPAVSDVVSELAFRLNELPPLPDSGTSLGSIQISASTAVAHNPAVEDNLLKLFLNLDQLTLNIPPITLGTGGGGVPTPTRIEKSRVRTGPAHLTGAISEGAFRRVFEVIRDTGQFKINIAPQTMSLLGVTGSVSAEIEFHLDNGAVDFRSDHTIRIDELDIKWDKLKLTFGINLPSICFEICYPVLDWPPYECTEVGCLFGGNPDFSFPLYLPTIFTTEVSINAGIKTYYGTGPPNEWLVYITPSRVDVDVIDVADTVGDLFEAALTAAVSALGLPSWASDFVSNLADFIRGMLDIPDDIGEWLQGVIFDSLGLETSIESYISIWLADGMPIFRLEDPVEVMKAEGSLIPVNIPIEYLGARVDDQEMVLEADIGA